MKLRKNDLKEEDKEYFDELTNVGNIGVHEIVSFYQGYPVYHHFGKDIKELVTNHVYINKHEKKGITYNDRSKEGLNWFITPNTYAHHKRNVDNVIGLKACWVDIDTEKAGISEERFVALLPDILGDMKQPPNSIIFSGHGFYFIFKFDKEIIVHRKESMINLWNKLEKSVVEDANKVINESFFEKDICDKSATDVCRLLRLQGSYNYKNLAPVRKCKTIMNDLDSYSFFELVNEYLPPYDPNYSRQYRINHSIIIKLKYNFYTLKVSRDADLKKLVQLRNYDLKGFRNNIIFLVAHNACYYKTNEEVIDEINEINDSFNEPLPRNEMRYFEARINYLDLANIYKYSNKRIIEVLDIQDNEQKQLRTIINKSEKYNRNNKRRRNNTKNKKNIRNNKIKKLNKSGTSNRKIAKQLRLSRNTVNKVIKSIK